MKILKCFGLFLILFLADSKIYGQKKDKVEVVPKVPAQVIAKNCERLQLGKIVFFQVPDYPPEARAARVGGTVVVNIKLNETGAMPEIETVSGNKFLTGAATEAARKVKFTPTLCDDVALPVRVVMIYNFIPSLETEIYTAAAKIEDFSDIDKNSEFYEAILDLTENYHIAFGYADKKFYADAPLTRGDFAHFLRLTLDLLSERAALSGKLPSRRSRLFSPLNPQNLKSARDVKKLEKNKPFADSVKILLLKYDIALVNEKNEFSGGNAVGQNEVIDRWTKIFGTEAVPVNFSLQSAERIMTRGEFALFLQESLGVLTYKILP